MEFLPAPDSWLFQVCVVSVVSSFLGVCPCASGIWHNPQRIRNRLPVFSIIMLLYLLARLDLVLGQLVSPRRRGIVRNLRCYGKKRY
ncbi:unnamed protein product [Gadus morhua 'NCC']